MKISFYKFVLIGCTLLLIDHVVAAQDSITQKKRHFISLQTGFDRHIVRDDIISPLIYKGAGMPVYISYRFCSSKNSHSFSIYYDQLRLKSSITTKIPTDAFYTKNYNGLFEYSYYRKIHSFTKTNTEVFAGVEIKSLLNYRDHYYDNYIHYTTGELITSLGISCLVIKKFDERNEDFITFQINVPLVAHDLLNYLYNANVVKENNTNADLNTSGNMSMTTKPVTLNKHFEVGTDLSYVKFLSKHIGIKLNYRFRYYKTEKFDDLFDVTYVNYQVLAGLIIKM